MEKIFIKTIIALFLGLTVGLFTGYTINATKYYAYGSEATKEMRDVYIEQKIEERKSIYSPISTSDYETLLIKETTKTVYNKKVGLLFGSTTATILIILLLGSELKKKAKKDE